MDRARRSGPRRRDRGRLARRLRRLTGGWLRPRPRPPPPCGRARPRALPRRQPPRPRSRCRSGRRRRRHAHVHEHRETWHSHPHGAGPAPPPRARAERSGTLGIWPQRELDLEVGLMAFYRDLVFPRVMNLLMDTKETRRFRREVFALEGDVVEIGFGAGLNLRIYPPQSLAFERSIRSPRAASWRPIDWQQPTCPWTSSGSTAKSCPSRTSRPTPCCAHGRYAASPTLSPQSVRSSGSFDRTAGSTSSNRQVAGRQGPGLAEPPLRHAAEGRVRLQPEPRHPRDRRGRASLRRSSRASTPRANPSRSAGRSRLWRPGAPSRTFYSGVETSRSWVASRPAREVRSLRRRSASTAVSPRAHRRPSMARRSSAT